MNENNIRIISIRDIATKENIDKFVDSIFELANSDQEPVSSCEELISSLNEKIDKLQQTIVELNLQNQALVANDKHNDVTLKQFKELTEKYTHEIIEGQRKDATIKDLLTKNAELLKANNTLCKDN